MIAGGVVLSISVSQSVVEPVDAGRDHRPRASTARKGVTIARSNTGFAIFFQSDGWFHRFDSCHFGDETAESVSNHGSKPPSPRNNRVGRR
jgi:hypothetical protein